VLDQYFYKDTELTYHVALREPSGVDIDSVAVPFVNAATGSFELEVPGQLLKSNAPQKNGNVMTWPLAYGGTLDVDVTFRQFEWVPVVSVILVLVFLVYLSLAGIKSLGQRGKSKAA
jgi:hypothetical protein